VKGNGTTTATSNYQFHVASDATTGNNSVTYFRLKQTDFDRTSTTSNIIAISLNGDEQSIKIYPNPSNANTVSLELNENVEAVTLTNAIGQTVFQQKTNGQIFLTIDVTALAMGVYSVKTITSNGQSEVVKFVKN
jgi:predicted translin family RNA/ssDNA-binding protein